MQRHALGIIALVFLLIGAGSYFNLTGSVVGQSGVATNLMRIGLVLGAIWLAIPQLETKSPWTLFGIGVAIIAGFANPKFFAYVLVGLVVFAIGKQAWQRYWPKITLRRTTRGIQRDSRK